LARTRASTGPPHRCGGMNITKCAAVEGSYKLQRGRRIAAAEWRFASFARQPDAELQRGRRIAAAEWEPPEPRYVTRGVASTGPPHRCGGMRMGKTRRGCQRHPLQRGRRIAAAEWPSALRLNNMRTCFNGAAASLRRNARVAGTEGGEAKGFNGAAASLRRNAGIPLPCPRSPAQASTGPPHRCGGMSSTA